MTKTKEIKLELFKEEEFLGTRCDFYKDENNSIYMTREQIGEALQYSNPQKAMDNLHSRNKERLNKFSVTLKMRASDGKAYNTTLYIEKGIYEICRFTKQPVANDFYDWVYDKIELIRRNAGTVEIGREKEFLDAYFPTLQEETKLMMVQDLQKTIQQKDKEIKELTPKADNWSAYMDAKGNITVANLAKALNIKGIGRNKLFDILRDNKLLRSNNEPYQSFVNSGYFEVVTGFKNGFKFNQTLVTGKGMNYIRKKMVEWGHIKIEEV
jgi:anti-repressor protein